MQSGPDPSFREPGSPVMAEGFSTAPTHGPFGFGDPIQCAQSKALLFPDEGGPVILEIELPDDVANSIIGGLGRLEWGKALNTRDEIRFEPGGGLEQLLDAWPQLAKRIVTLQGD